MDFITSERLFIIIIGLAFLFIILLILHINLEMRMRKIMRGKSARDLEDLFIKMNEDFSEYKIFKSELEKYLSLIEQRIQSSIRGVEAINFNAFSGTESGGKSFAIAIVDENKNGIIISSLQSRERLSVFTKNIKNGKCEQELSLEENAALTKAQKSCSLSK